MDHVQFYSQANHFGYLGYRGFISAISNNGAMDRVATDCKEQ
jgi:hypothetical protein